MKQLCIECDITSYCNLKCPRCNRFCDISSTRENDMTLDDFNGVISQVSKYSIKRFRIIGGEPTLHPLLIDFCRVAQSCEKIQLVEVCSNMTNTTEISSLKEKCPDISVINFDGASGCDFQRIKAMKYMKHQNIFISPAEAGLRVKDFPCSMANVYEDYGCGCHVFKLHGKLKFMYCAVCSAVTRLLCKEDVFFTSLDAMLQSDWKSVLVGICPNCMFNAEHPIRYFRDKSVSDCFSAGIEAIKLRT